MKKTVPLVTPARELLLGVSHLPFVNTGVFTPPLLQVQRQVVEAFEMFTKTSDVAKNIGKNLISLESIFFLL